jgi:hypothetical protein
MTERPDTMKDRGREIGLSEEDIKLLYSLTPDNFEEFRKMFYSHFMDIRSVITFCAA